MVTTHWHSIKSILRLLVDVDVAPKIHKGVEVESPIDKANYRK